MENNWTASTNTSWIYFDIEHTLKRISGTGEENIIIYIYPKSTNPYDQEEGYIKIETDTFVITKVIKRCVPTILEENKVLKCKVNGQDPNETINVGPCSNGSDSSNGSGIEITDILLVVTKVLSDGLEPLIENYELSLKDVNVTYILPDGSSFSYLPTNEGKDRNVTLKIEYLSDRTVKPVMVTLYQKGVLNSDGTLNMDEIVESTIECTDKNVYITNFGFDWTCRNIKTSCEGGTMTLVCEGMLCTSLGSTTAKTVCDKVVELDKGDSSCVDLPSDKITYSISPSDAGEINGNTLTYYTNESRVNSKVITIYAEASVLDDNGNTINSTTSTTLTLAPGDCAGKLYLHLTADKYSVPYEGGEVVFTYYLSDVSQDDESRAIKDNDNCLNFTCPNGISSCGEPVESGNAYKRTVKIGNNASKTEQWTFRVTCQQSEPTEKIIIINQALKGESIIPTTDYIIFNYNWTSEDGKDLDSLTVISNPDMMVRAENGRDIPASSCTVGYHGISEFFVEKEGGGKFYIRFGGDNKCNGTEYTIICLKNILDIIGVDAISTSGLYIDIYANWYSEKKNGGGMSVTCKQYDGKTVNGNFDDEIKLITHTDCPQGNYREFAPVDGACEQVGETITSDKRTVRAFGRYNWILARDNVSCLDKIYTHVLRVKCKNVGGDIITSLDYFDDKGFDAVNEKREITYNGTKKNIIGHKVNVAANTETTLTGILLNYSPKPGENYTVYPFEDNRNYIYVTYENIGGAAITIDDIGRVIEIGDGSPKATVKVNLNGENGAVDMSFKIYESGKSIYVSFFCHTKYDMFGCGENTVLTMDGYQMGGLIIKSL